MHKARASSRMTIALLQHLSAMLDAENGGIFTVVFLLFLLFHQNLKKSLTVAKTTGSSASSTKTFLLIRQRSDLE